MVCEAGLTPEGWSVAFPHHRMRAWLLEGKPVLGGGQGGRSRWNATARGMGHPAADSFHHPPDGGWSISDAVFVRQPHQIAARDVRSLSLHKTSSSTRCLLTCPARCALALGAFHCGDGFHGGGLGKQLAQFAINAEYDGHPYEALE
jgi:hypothetical protein